MQEVWPVADIGCHHICSFRRKKGRNDFSHWYFVCNWFQSISISIWASSSNYAIYSNLSAVERVVATMQLVSIHQHLGNLEQLCNLFQSIGSWVSVSIWCHLLQLIDIHTSLLYNWDEIFSQWLVFLDCLRNSISYNDEHQHWIGRT